MNWYPLWLSFQVATCATLITAFVGVALGAVLTRPRLPGRELVDALVTLPMVLPPTVVGYYLLVALGRDSWFGELYRSVTGQDLMFTFEAAVVAATVGSLPLVIKSSRAALEGVDDTLVAAARTLGAGPMRAFLTVRLPLASRGIFAGLMLGFARALGDFGATMMVAGALGKETETAAIHIYNLWQNQQESEMAAMVAVFTALAIFIMWGVNHLSRGRRAV